MKITCEKCHTDYQLNDDVIKKKDTQVRCSKCSHIFKISPPTVDSIKIPESSTLFDEVYPNSDSQPSSLPFDKFKFDMALYPRKKYTPFRTKLMYFEVLLIGFLIIIVIPIELYRPWERLNQLIYYARNLIGGTQAGIEPPDLKRMNRLAMDIIEKSDISNAEIPDIYYSIAFNMLVIEGNILSEKAIQNKLVLFKEFKDEKCNYQKLLTASQYWEIQFSTDPGIFDILRKNKAILMKAKDNAKAAGFEFSEIMIMMDIGKKEGHFTDSIAFIMESSNWWKNPTYIGQLYSVPPELEYWRGDTISGKEGYGNDPISAKNWYLPHFVEDEWGTWYSVWLTKKNAEIYNIFSIDVNASDVKKMLMMVMTTAAVVILILLLLVVFITRRLSRLITRPITELIKGVEEVAKGNYNYEVPIIKDDEFGELTNHFNLMTKGQKERINLMETLEKFLSRELAEKAAKSGLVLGGQKANCTVMFTDFAGFSTITQKMSPVESVNVLNGYYNALIPIIKNHGGFPDKYIGDAIVAMFGAPIRLEDHAERAVACAIEMQWKMREINEMRRREGKTIFEMRIGLNSGDVIVGAIGCDMKLEYTSIGETTNLANRMESICEIGHIMIAEGTYHQIKNIFFKGVDIDARPQRVKVKGYPQPVETYRIFVDNLSIDKDIAHKGNSFYIYKNVDNKIKYKPEDRRVKHSVSVSKHLK